MLCEMERQGRFTLTRTAWMNPVGLTLRFHSALPREIHLAASRRKLGAQGTGHEAVFEQSLWFRLFQVLVPVESDCEQLIKIESGLAAGRRRHGGRRRVCSVMVCRNCWWS